MKAFKMYSEYEKELAESQSLMDIQFAYDKEIMKWMKLGYQVAAKHELVVFPKAQYRWWQLFPEEFGNTNGNEGVQSHF